MKKTNVEKRLGNIYGFTGGSFAGIVYDTQYLSPSLNTCNGGNRQPMIVEPEYTLNRLLIFSVASRGRNPENPGDRNPGIPTEQRLEVNQSGYANTITSVSKDSMVLEIHG